MKFMIAYDQVAQMLKHAKPFTTGNRLFFAYRDEKVLFEAGGKDYYFRGMVDHSVVGGRSKKEHVVSLDFRLFRQVFRLVKPKSSKILLLEFPRKDGLIKIGDVQIKPSKNPDFPHAMLRDMFEKEMPFPRIDIDFPLRAVSQVASASNNSSTASYSTVCLDFARGAAFATDGHRMHIVDDVFQPQEGAGGVRLPSKIVRYVRQFGNNGNVLFTPTAYSDKSSGCSIIYHGVWSLVFREEKQVFGKVLDTYDAVLPDEKDVALLWTFDAALVIDALNKCVPLGNPLKSYVCLRIDGETVTLDLDNADWRGKYSIDLSPYSTIDPIQTSSAHVHLNAAYLRDLFRSARANGKCKELSLRIPAETKYITSPLAVMTDNGFRGGVMMMRMDECPPAEASK